MNDKEQWVNEVLESIEGIQRATPSDSLFDQISQQLPSKTSVKVIPVRRLAWAAAVACILIAVNVFSLTTSLTDKADDPYTNLYETPVLNNFDLYQ